MQDSPEVGNWAEFTFAKASGSVTKDREKQWPIAEQRFPVTIQETIAERISSPVLFPFLKW